MFTTNTFMFFAFVLSACAAILCGFDAAFNVYALTLKDTFNFTQTEVELVASMGTLGLVLTFLEAFLTKVFGYKFMCCLIMMTVPVFSALFALVIFYRDVLDFHLGLVSVIQLILSTGDCMAYVVITRVMVEILPEKHSGKIVTFFLVCICCGKLLFGGIIDLLFPGNLFAFFVTLAVLTFVTFGSCFLCLNTLIEHKTRQSATNSKEASFLLLEDQDNGDTPVKDLLRSPIFHAIFWTSIVLNACGYASLNNVTIIADSVGETDSMDYVYIMSVVIIINRLIFGVLFDKFRSELCGFFLSQITIAGFVSAMVIGIFTLDESTMFLTTIFLGIGYACSSSTPLCICIRMFGRTCYSYVTGVFFTMTGICQILLQISFGYFYDRKGEESGLYKKCYGRGCFFWFSLVMLLMTILTSVVQLITCYVSQRKNRESHKT